MGNSAKVSFAPFPPSWTAKRLVVKSYPIKPGMFSSATRFPSSKTLLAIPSPLHW